MTKRELIDKLALYPDDILVLTGTDPQMLHSADPTEIFIMKHAEPDGPWGDVYYEVSKSESNIRAIWLGE